MLVLSRKALERIQIGEDVTVTVLEIRGNKVRIGIVAPTETPIRRTELPTALSKEPLVSRPVAIESTER